MRRLRLVWTILALLLLGAALGRPAPAAPCPHHGEPEARPVAPASGEARVEPGLSPGEEAHGLAVSHGDRGETRVPCCAPGDCALHCTAALPAAWTIDAPGADARHGPPARGGPPAAARVELPWRPPPVSLRAAS